MRRAAFALRAVLLSFDEVLSAHRSSGVGYFKIKGRIAYAPSRVFHRLYYWRCTFQLMPSGLEAHPPPRPRTSIPYQPSQEPEESTEAYQGYGQFAPGPKAFGDFGVAEEKVEETGDPALEQTHNKRKVPIWVLRGVLIYMRALLWIGWPVGCGGGRTWYS